MLQTNMKKFPGLYIIAAYFLINGVGGFYQLIPFISEGNLTSAIYPPLIYNTGFLIAAVGLVGLKGWGRNFALFFNGISVITGLRHLLTYYFADTPEFVSIIKGLSDFLIAGLIYHYLFKAKIKILFSVSPVSWSILGIFLLFYSIDQDTGNMVIDTFWGIMMVVGMAITGYGAKQLRKNVPQDPIYMKK